jgi:tetratricopeptide (TPR) repeat protein
VHIARAEYNKAVEDFTKGIDLAPNVEGLSKRAALYERLGAYNKALADFKAALQLAPTLNTALEGVKRLSEQQK